MRPDTTTQPHGLPASRMCQARNMRTMPPTISAMPRNRVRMVAAGERVLEGDDAGGDIERAQQPPEDGLAPVLDAEGGDDLGHARHDHHDADDQHRRGGGGDDAAQRNDAGDHEDDAQRHDPSPFGAERPDAVAQAVRAPGRSWSPSWRPPSLRNWTGCRIHAGQWHCRGSMGHSGVPGMQAEMTRTEERTGAAAPARRPCCWCARPSPATWPRRSKSSWWCATTRSTPSPARWCSPAASSRTPTAIPGCGRAAAAPTRSRDERAEVPRRRRARGLRGMRHPAGAQARPARRDRRRRPQGDRGEVARQARQGRGQHRRPGRGRGSRARHRPHGALRPLDHADLRAPALRHLVLPGRGAGGPDRAA